jgi:sugar O-acyltransferase (sialic acid O-acetyltransferase NeuD family)
MKDRKLILIGDGAFAEIAYEYFTRDSRYEVVAFAVERAFMKRDRLFDLPIAPYEDIEKRYAPREHYFYACLVYSQLNRLRTRFYHSAKEKGYSPASYISRHAFVWSNVRLGEHCFIFENNVVQPFVSIGDNVVLWSGNHIGHHSKIGDHCFISSHVVVSGFCEVGSSSFLGVNATLANNVTIGVDSLIGAGATIVRDTPEDALIRGNLSDLSRPSSARRYFKVAQEQSPFQPPNAALPQSGNTP